MRIDLTPEELVEMCKHTMPEHTLMAYKGHVFLFTEGKWLPVCCGYVGWDKPVEDYPDRWSKRC